MPTNLLKKNKSGPDVSLETDEEFNIDKLFAVDHEVISPESLTPRISLNNDEPSDSDEEEYEFV